MRVREAAFLAVIFSGVCQSEPATPGSECKIAPLVSLFQQERPREEDKIILRDGEVLPGKVLDETFELTTPYGDLAVPVGRCAGVAYRGPADSRR